jgi:hypothetical protein
MKDPGCVSLSMADTCGTDRREMNPGWRVGTFIENCKN